MTDYRIRPLDAAVDTTDFCCGKRTLDEYIRRYASQDVRRDVARVFVATPDDSQRLAGIESTYAARLNRIALMRLYLLTTTSEQYSGVGVSDIHPLSFHFIRIKRNQCPSRKLRDKLGVDKLMTGRISAA